MSVQRIIGKETYELFESWEERFEKIKNSYQDFSEGVTKYDRESDKLVKERVKFDLFEEYDTLVDEYNFLKDEITEKNDDNVLFTQMSYIFKKLEELNKNMIKNGYYSYGEASSGGRIAREKIMKEFKLGVRGKKYGNVELGTKVSEVLADLKKYLKSQFERFNVPNGSFIQYAAILDKRQKEFSNMLPKSSSPLPGHTPNK